VQAGIKHEAAFQLKHVRTPASHIVLLEHQYSPPHTREHGSASESAHPASDDDGIYVRRQLLDLITIREDSLQHLLPQYLLLL
jgi:hypothetical protein